MDHGRLRWAILRCFLQNWSKIDFVKSIYWEIIFLIILVFFMFLMRDPLNQPPPLSPFRRGRKEIRGFLRERTSDGLWWAKSYGENQKIHWWLLKYRMHLENVVKSFAQFKSLCHWLNSRIIKTVLKTWFHKTLPCLARTSQGVTDPISESSKCCCLLIIRSTVHTLCDISWREGNIHTDSCCCF